jgi:NAD(P)-dependent dehydrogenase (short-subunit alcohol dehydrogenase family)
MQKTFIIAGGSSGIGRALYQQLSDAGHHVIVLSRERHDLPDSAEHHVVDFSDSALILPDITAELHGIVYMPGSILLKPFRSLSRGDYETDYRLNVLGAVDTIKKYQSLLSKNTTTSILLMSTVAVGTGMPYHSLVASSKGAIEGLTRALAAELSPNIRVNAIAPSLTETPLAEKLLNTEEKKQAGRERHPMKQIGQSEDIAAYMAMLLSDAAKFVTGQILAIDGGMGSLRK